MHSKNSNMCKLYFVHILILVFWFLCFQYYRSVKSQYYPWTSVFISVTMCKFSFHYLYSWLDLVGTFAFLSLIFSLIAPSRLFTVFSLVLEISLLWSAYSLPDQIFCCTYLMSGFPDIWGFCLISVSYLT